MKKGVRKPALLALFSSTNFVIVLLVSILIRFLELRITGLRIISGPQEPLWRELVDALQWAQAPALYLSIMLSLSYSSRKAVPVSFTVPFLTILFLVITLGLSLGIRQFESLPEQEIPSDTAIAPGEKGLILNQTGVSTILLRSPGDLRGPRVVSLPGQPLIYHEVPLGPNNTVLPLPPLPFRNESSPFLTSLFIDFSLTARQLEARLGEGILSLAMYAAALILLLSSLRFVLDIGSWPLASLFLGALAFRGILALETFLNSREIQEFLWAFSGERIPQTFISPLVFCTLSLLVLLFTGLVYLAKGRRAEG